MSESYSFDGTGNNLADPQFNAANTGLRRLGTMHFVPGTGNQPIDGPNARMISNVMSGDAATGANDPTLSGMMYAWGQFIDHDLDLVKTDRTDVLPIVVPADDKSMVPGSTIALSRSVMDVQGQPINTISPWMDASMVYGSSSATAASLHQADGHMLTRDGANLPLINGRPTAGDVRVTENPDLIAVSTLFVREHNFWVDQLQTQHPGWSGDQLYTAARTIVTAEIQHITYDEFLPHLLGPTALQAYSGYDPQIDPRVTAEFAGAAYRFGHSIVSDNLEQIDNVGTVLSAETLSQAFSETPEDFAANGGADGFLRHLAAHPSQALDPYVINSLRNLLALGPGPAQDLVALDIERTRDLGLGTLNEARQSLGLSHYTTFNQISSDPATLAKLQAAFGSVDQIDLFTGGLAEDHAAGAMVGPTFQRIIADQFEALRDGDRLWYQNQDFDPATLRAIQGTMLSDIIARDTDTTGLQPDVFVTADRHAASSVSGGEGPQLVIADAQGAVATGGPGDDTIFAGAGLHGLTMTGGGGRNLFIFGGGGTDATITDFVAGQDQLAFGLSLDDVSQVVINRSGSGTTILAGGDQVTLPGVASVGLSDIIFKPSAADMLATWRTS